MPAAPVCARPAAAPTRHPRATHATRATPPAPPAACWPAYPGLHAYPYGRNGSLMKLVAEVVGLDARGRTLDVAIYLIDPVDPASIFPEAVAFERQCVSRGKPLIATVATARDWVECERSHAGCGPDPGADDRFDFESQTQASIAHDACKPQLLSCAAAHFDVLSRFAERVGTGAGSQQPAAQRADMEAAAGGARAPWVRRYHGGSLGGDAQIADRVLGSRCPHAVVFEDLHVARQHEADIRLFERARHHRHRPHRLITALQVARGALGGSRTPARWNAGCGHRRHGRRRCRLRGCGAINEPDAFWAWFSANVRGFADAYASADVMRPDASMDELLDALHACCGHPWFETVAPPTAATSRSFRPKATVSTFPPFPGRWLRRR